MYVMLTSTSLSPLTGPDVSNRRHPSWEVMSSVPGSAYAGVSRTPNSKFEKGWLFWQRGSQDSMKTSKDVPRPFSCPLLLLEDRLSPPERGDTQPLNADRDVPERGVPAPSLCSSKPVPSSSPRAAHAEFKASLPSVVTCPSDTCQVPALLCEAPFHVARRSPCTHAHTHTHTLAHTAFI